MSPGTRFLRQVLPPLQRLRRGLVLRLGPSPGSPLQLPAVPLRVTAATTALLLLVPALVLWRLPRPRAEGLGRVIAQAALLQSFPAAPERPVPRLWQERFGAATASQLWRSQRGLWWQYWGRQGDGPAYLVVPMPRPMRSGALPRPAHSAVVDDLLVVAADPLSHRLLTDQLRQRHRARRGMEQRCLARLEREQAAFWTPVALGVMGGALAPLLQGFQEGCVSLALTGEVLTAGGEAASGGGALAPPPPLPPLPQQPPADRQTVGAPTTGPAAAKLLQLRGRRLDGILDGLLSRQLILDPLASRYGIGAAELSLLRRTPFQLELRPLPSGPFQAGLSLRVVPGEARQAWADLLVGLRERLEQEGLSDAPSRPGAASSILPSSVWRRDDGVVVGGWRWLSREGAAPELLLFLGPEPPAVPEPATRPPLLAEAAWLELELAPRRLAALGLMPQELPAPLLQAERLWVEAYSSGEGEPVVSALRGRLQLTPADPQQASPRP